MTATISRTSMTSTTSSTSNRQRRSTRKRKPTKFDDEDDDNITKAVEDKNTMSNEHVEEVPNKSTTRRTPTTTNESSTTTTTTILDEENHVNWTSESQLWDLTVEMLRNELRRRKEYVAGSKYVSLSYHHIHDRITNFHFWTNRRVLINRLLGRDPLCKKYRLNPDVNVTEEEDVADKLRKKHANNEGDVDDDSEPLEGPKGDASLWSNKQLRYKLKRLGYSTEGKRTTLLKRFRSVMHILRQKELVTNDGSVAGISESKTAKQQAADNNNKQKRQKKRPPAKPAVERGVKRDRVVADIIEVNVPEAKPEVKRQRVEEPLEPTPTSSTPSTIDAMQIDNEDEPTEVKQETTTTASIVPAKKEPVRSAQYTLTDLDLCLSSSMIDTFNPELANRKILSDSEVDALEKAAEELNNSNSKGKVKDKNLLKSIKETQEGGSYLDEDLRAIQCAYSSYSQKKSRSKQQKGLSLQQHQMETNLVVSLSGIDRFSNLRRLVCVGQRLTDISPVSLCPNLEYVFLSHNFIRKIPSLEQLTKLSVLCLSFNQIVDLSPIGKCTSLEYLNLSFNNRIDDISAIAECPRLKELDLSGNLLDDTQVAQFEQFACSQVLSTLILNCNEITDLRPIGRTFLELQVLYLNKNQIEDLSPLIHLRKLTELDVQNNVSLLHSLHVYNANKIRQRFLRQQKQKELSSSKRSRSRGSNRSIAPTVTAAEEDEVSLLTGSIYDNTTQVDQTDLWLHYGKVNMECLECLVQFGARCVIAPDER
jgi:Leucine-rich repeat (LRR) protein